MNLSKEQRETYDNLLKLMVLRGKPYMLGWALGTLIRLSQHDYHLRKLIRDQLGKDRER